MSSATPLWKLGLGTNHKNIPFVSEWKYHLPWIHYCQVKTHRPRNRYFHLRKHINSMHFQINYFALNLPPTNIHALRHADWQDFKLPNQRVKWIKSSKCWNLAFFKNIPGLVWIKQQENSRPRIFFFFQYLPPTRTQSEWIKPIIIFLFFFRQSMGEVNKNKNILQEYSSSPSIFWKSVWINTGVMCEASTGLFKNILDPVPANAWQS